MGTTIADAFSIGNVAWYGAVVATLTFLFNLWKYWRERARLQVRIVLTVYSDGGYSHIEETPDGQVRTLTPYYHVEVINVGERATTIMGVSATTRAIGWLERAQRKLKGRRGEMGLAVQAFTPHYGNQFPHAIAPGGVWSCRVKQSQVDQLNAHGRPKFELFASCWRHPHIFSFPRRALEQGHTEE